jgi:hypothetical protein
MPNIDIATGLPALPSPDMYWQLRPTYEGWVEVHLREKVPGKEWRNPLSGKTEFNITSDRDCQVGRSAFVVETYPTAIEASEALKKLDSSKYRVQKNYDDSDTYSLIKFDDSPAAILSTAQELYAIWERQVAKEKVEKTAWEERQKLFGNYPPNILVVPTPLVPPKKTTSKKSKK